MAAIGGTMSGKDCDTSDMEAFRATVQIPRLPINQLPSFAPRSDMTTIVGAYYGGAQVACEVGAPAGSCFMRTGSDGFTIFCPVCRYALIDLIDPEQHWRNDLDYDKESTIQPWPRTGIRSNSSGVISSGGRAADRGGRLARRFIAADRTHRLLRERHPATLSGLGEQRPAMPAMQ